MRNHQRDYMFDYFIQGLDKTAYGELYKQYTKQTASRRFTISV